MLKKESEAIIVQKYQLGNADKKLNEMASEITSMENRINEIRQKNKSVLDKYKDRIKSSNNNKSRTPKVKERLSTLKKNRKKSHLNLVDEIDYIDFQDQDTWEDYLEKVENYAQNNDINLDLEYEKMFAFENITLVQLHKGIEPSIICIDGFLTKNDDGNRWLRNMPDELKKHSIYYLKWESQSFLDMVKEVLSPNIENFFFKAMPFKIVKDVIKVWNTATSNAEKAGKSLAGKIHNENKEYILVGHSLGSRVINYCLKNLSNTNKCIIKDIYLLGGAVQNHTNSWKHECDIVKNNIHNFLSTNDRILQFIYKVGESSKWELNEPVGRNFIHLKKVINHDVSDKIDGHTVYHENFNEIYKKYIASQ